MANESIHNASWYLCKENVEPLAAGRDVSKIDESNKNCLDTQRAAHEEKILLDDGDDPLQNWIEFIEWIEQSYPGGGKESRLMDVLTDCVQRFIEDDRYADDERFYGIFARYRRRLTDPLEKYDSLFSKKIFTKIARFYTDWSWLFECAGNFKEADNVLDRGLLIGAEPQDDIKTARVQLQTRLAKKIAKGENDEPTPEEQSAQRKALGGLKPRIKKDIAIAPVDRVSSLKPDSLGLSSGTIKPGNTAPAIYIDEENLTPEQLTVTGSVKASVIPDTKENSIKPGKWSDYRIRKKPIVKPQNEFVIYEEDEDKTVTSESPSNTTLSADVFKVRKRNENSPPLVKIENLSNAKFYCDLDKMYIGGTEYSFEEIRYKKWLKAKKLKEEQKSRQDHMDCLLQRIAELETRIAEKEENHENKEKETEEQIKAKEDLEKQRAAEEKEREQQDRYRDLKDKERELKDKERDVKDQERILLDKEVGDKEAKRCQNELERLENEAERMKEEKERQRAENDRILAEKERVLQEKEREIMDKERGKKIQEMDQVIQGLEAKLSTLIKFLQEKKPENHEVSTMVRNLLNGSYNETLPMAIAKPTVPVKDFTIYKDEPTVVKDHTIKELPADPVVKDDRVGVKDDHVEVAPLIRFDITEAPRSESTLKFDPDVTTMKQKLEKMDPKSDFENIHRGSMHFRFSEAFTMMVPQSEDECLPRSCSTPGK